MNILSKGRNYQYTDDNGSIVTLDTCFKNVLKAYKLIEDNRLDEADKTKILLRLFLGVQEIKNINLALEHIVKYIRIMNDTNEIESNNTRIFDFEHDSQYIFSAFMQAYNINLIDSDMSWVEFISLFRGLPENTRMSEIMKIRAMKIPKPTKNNLEERKNIEKLKNIYRLPTTEKEKESNGKKLDAYYNSIREAMRNGR